MPRASDHAEVVAFTTTMHHRVEVMRTWYRTQAFARHTHPYFTLGVVLRGAGTLWSAGVTNTMAPGDIVLIPPGEVHTGGLDERGGILSYVALHVPPELVALASPGNLRASVFSSPDIARELRRVDAAVGAGSDAMELEAAIVGAIDLLARRAGGRSDGSLSRPRDVPRFVALAQSAIDDCYAENGRISLAALAKVAGVSPFHLAREFKRISGLSPHQYVIQTRVRRAAELLARGAPISDTAATVGFADQSHLTTQFRRYFGITPASWQRGCRV